jgi:hypothetical protein
MVEARGWGHMAGKGYLGGGADRKRGDISKGYKVSLREEK